VDAHLLQQPSTNDSISRTNDALGTYGNGSNNKHHKGKVMRTRLIDLRSDTVTRPSKAMLEVMTAAEVGDDVWGDDPTVQRLQHSLAERAGKEAGLFFPSGTQSNLAALMAHCARGDEYIVGQLAHTYKYEGGGAAVLGSIQPQPIENAPDGSLPLDKVASSQSMTISRVHASSRWKTLLGARFCQPSMSLRRLALRRKGALQPTWTAHVSSTRQSLQGDRWQSCVRPSNRFRFVFPKAWGPPSDPCSLAVRRLSRSPIGGGKSWAADCVSPAF
jgi:hypothetical protein